MGWVVEGKSEGRLGLLGPGPGWKLICNGGAGLLRLLAGAGLDALAWPCRG